MKNSIKTLKEQRSIALDELNAMVNLAEAENRNFNEEEQKTFDEKSVKIEDLDKRMERMEKAFKLSNATPVVHSIQNVADTDKDLRKYSIAEASRQAMNNTCTGVVAEMHQEAVNEGNGRIFRGIGVPAIALEKRSAVAFNATGSSAEANSTQTLSFVDQITRNSVLAQAGAEVFSGLSANQKLPVLNGISATYIAEDGTGAPTSAGTVEGKILSPKKCVSVVEYTQEMLVQNASVDSALERNMASVIAQAMESKLLAIADASSHVGPNTIFGLSDVGGSAVTATSALDLAGVFDLETQVLANSVDRTNLSYICNASALAKMKSLAGTDFVAGFYDPGAKTINSYPFYVTQNLGIASDGSTVDGNDQYILFGNMNSIKLAFFGGLDLVSDKYTLAQKGISRLIVLSLNDGICARPDKDLRRFVNIIS